MPERIHTTISAQDARVLKALCDPDDVALDLIADALGIAWSDFRASLRRLAGAGAERVEVDR